MDYRPWDLVETRVQGRIMAQVSARQDRNPERPPAYSIRIGTAQLIADGTTRISAHMSIYDAEDAVRLLQELSEKYKALRASGEPSEAPRRGIGQMYRRVGREGGE